MEDKNGPGNLRCIKARLMNLLVSMTIWAILFFAACLVLLVTVGSSAGKGRAGPRA